MTAYLEHRRRGIFESPILHKYWLNGRCTEKMDHGQSERGARTSTDNHSRRHRPLSDAPI